MDHVGVDIDGKVAADGTRSSVKRISSAHEGAHLSNSGKTGNDHLDDRTARHKVAETAKEGFVGQMGVVLLDGSALERGHLHALDDKAAALNASNDLADLAVAHGVGLNHDEGLLDSHKVAFQVGSRVPKSHSGTRLDCIVTEF